jgi:hypothetical protein
MSARKIAFLVLIVLFAASVETAWNVRDSVAIGPEGCRAMGGRFYGPSWSFEANGERAVGSASPKVEVDNAFGTVKVSPGADGVVRVKLRKVVFLPTEEKARAFAERVELRLAGSGDVVKVATNRDDLGRRDDVGLETHLEIEVPAATAVEVRDEHGRVEVAGVAAADVTASFDGVSVARVTGDVAIDVRHGNVSVERVGGKLKLKARHGDVELESIVGAAELDVEHGRIAARGAGPLTAALSFGDFTAAGVLGDLSVRGHHAPSTASDVSGRADVETAFGDVRLERVGGDGRVKVEHGHIAASDVSGGIVAEASHEGVELERVKGPVDVHVEHGGVVARGLESGGRVRASGDDVTLEGFAGALEVEVERGSAKLAPGAPITSALSARASHGEVSLKVPEGSAFRLEAESQHGQVTAPLAGLAAQGDERRRGERVTGQHGAGGPQVLLHADGDVTLEASEARAVSAGVEKPRTTAATTPEAPSERPNGAPSPRPSPAERTPAPR